MDEMKRVLLRMKNQDVMKRLLRASFKDIAYNYELLTTQEKLLVSPEEFEILLEEIQP